MIENLFFIFCLHRIVWIFFGKMIPNAFSYEIDIRDIRHLARFASAFTMGWIPNFMRADERLQFHRFFNVKIEHGMHFIVLSKENFLIS